MERFGFVGLPNAGKSSLYNALSGGSALAAPYAFATKDPNVGMAKVPDHRLEQLAVMSNTKTVIPASVQFVDIGFSPIYTGYQFTDGILRMLTGGVPDTTNAGVARVFNKETVADLTLTPDAYATNDWYGPDTYEQTFLTAWGAK